MAGFKIIGEAPMDEEKYDLGEKPTLQDAQKVADAFVATDSTFTAEVKDPDGKVVYSPGTM